MAANPHELRDVVCIDLVKATKTGAVIIVVRVDPVRAVVKSLMQFLLRRTRQLARNP